jgi:hypothetical protein
MDRKRVAEILGVPELLTPEGRHRLSRAETKERPGLLWNAFVDIVSVAPESLPAGPRRSAALALLYESEVQNGGHEQYFDNTDCKYVDETIRALGELGDHCRARVLAQAYEEHEAEDGSLGPELDKAFHACQPKLTLVLEAHLLENEDIYIEWTQ